MSSRAIKITGIFIILLVAAGGIVYYFWNKPHLNVANTEGIKIDAITLYKTFATDTVAAQKKYIQRVVEVSGNINRVSANQQNKYIVLIKTATEGASVNCTMEEAINNPDLKENDRVTIKGICSGLGQGDADLGIMGDVYLTRCYLVK